MSDTNTPAITPPGVAVATNGHLLAVSPTVSEQRDQEHLDYLSRLAESGFVPRELAAAAVEVWSRVKVQTRNRAAVPVATAGEGGPIGFNWDDRDRHLEAEIIDTKSVEWFYRNRATGEVLTHECGVSDLLPPAWVSLLEIFSTSTGTNG